LDSAVSRTFSLAVRLDKAEWNPFVLGDQNFQIPKIVNVR
jgi:hypothetical protein